MAVRQTPYGSVEQVHAGADFEAWWILKDGEEIEPGPAVMDRDDLLYVAEGSLRLEVEGREPLVLHAGELFVIPAGTMFRGYRWPRETDQRCRFLAVARAGAHFTRLVS
jgi:mannose-6-phosphate isomerase-like protein (cupin superfamily)